MQKRKGEAKICSSRPTDLFFWSCKDKKGKKKMKMKKVFLPILVAVFAFALMLTSNQATAAEKKLDGARAGNETAGGSSVSASYRYVVNCKYYVSMKKSASSSSSTKAYVPYGHRVTYLGKKGSYSKVSFYSVMDKKTYTGYIKSSYLAKSAYVYYEDIYRAFMKWRGMSNKVYYSYCLGPYDSSQGGNIPALLTSNYSKSSGRTIYMYVYTNGAVRRVEFNGKSGKYTLTPAGKWLLYNSSRLAYKQSSGTYRVLSWTSMTKAKLVTKKVSSKYMTTLPFDKFK